MAKSREWHAKPALGALTKTLDHETTKEREEHEARRAGSGVGCALSFVGLALRAFAELRVFVIHAPSHRAKFWITKPRRRRKTRNAKGGPASGAH